MHMKALDLMTRQLVTVRPETPLLNAVRLMLEHRVSGLPVVDGAGMLTGLLTEGDLLHRTETGTDAVQMGWLKALVWHGHMAERYVHTHGRRVQDVMTRDVLTVGEASSLDDVVRIMETRHVRRVPVVKGRRLVGMISRSDLIRALGAVLERVADDLEQDDGAIRESILAEMARQRWATSENIDVSVKDGMVEFQGTIFDDRMRDAMRVIAEAVPGVKGVRANLDVVDRDSIGVYGV
jgi:CBS domain-containing protein